MSDLSLFYLIFIAYGKSPVIFYILFLPKELILFSCFFISFTITILIERRLNLNWFKITITLTVVISLFPVREHNIRSLKLLTLTSSLCQPGTLTHCLRNTVWSLWGLFGRRSAGLLVTFSVHEHPDDGGGR